MERRICNRVDMHQTKFKHDIQTYLQDNNCMKPNELSEFMTFVYDYDKLRFAKDDFSKRKRIKSVVPQYDRCTACIANHEQCTRRKKNEEHTFCGTHIKGTPHGVVDIGLIRNPVKKIEVWVQEIKGIHYYIDDNNNVYLPQDIISNTKSPRVIGTWTLLESGEYSIPNLENEV